MGCPAATDFHIASPVATARAPDRKTLEPIAAESLPVHAPIALQGVQVGEGVRLIALEGEPMGAQGRIIEEVFPDGTTLSLGYANGEGLYLATTDMLREGGYESVSYWEFGWPASLAPGNEEVLRDGLQALRASAIA